MPKFKVGDRVYTIPPYNPDNIEGVVLVVEDDFAEDTAYFVKFEGWGGGLSEDVGEADQGIDGDCLWYFGRHLVLAIDDFESNI